jgi:hypothetical protein
MAKSADRRTVATAHDRTPKARSNQSAQVTDTDIARRAYDLYLARGCEHGHHVNDWLQAECELREAASSTVRSD